MALALYGPDGFYSTTGRAGRRGDFLTSPEVGPLFGTVLAQFCDEVWHNVGEPSDFTIIDAGAGPGTLARSILAADPLCLKNGKYVAVEVSQQQRSQHPEGIQSVAMMPTHVENGVVIANELLDNLPFELWVYDDGWKEAYVVSSGEGFSEVLMNKPIPTCLPTRAPLGSRAPVQRAAGEWLRSSLQSLNKGSIVVIDYCTALTAEVASMPWREWLRTYTGHNKGAHYLKDIGQQDITTQVIIDQLSEVREPDSVRSQSQFLQLLGIDDLVAEGKRLWEESASSPTLAAMKMRSRVSEAEALLDPTGLGNFTVLEWRIR